MNAVPRFCGYCGTPLEEGVRFCGHCGKPVGAPAAQPNPAPPPPPPPAQSYTPAYAPAAQGEIIYGVIPGARRPKGFLGFGSDMYVLVVTSHRLIFATQTNEMMRQNVDAARMEAKAQGKGFFGQVGAQMGANNGQMYLQMPPQAILNECSGNFFLTPQQMRSIKVKENYDDDSGRTDYEIHLETITEKIKLNFAVLHANQTRQLLRQLFGGAVR